MPCCKWNLSLLLDQHINSKHLSVSFAQQQEFFLTQLPLLLTHSSKSIVPAFGLVFPRVSMSVSTLLIFAPHTFSSGPVGRAQEQQSLISVTGLTQRHLTISAYGRRLMTLGGAACCTAGPLATARICRCCKGQGQAACYLVSSQVGRAGGPGLSSSQRQGAPVADSLQKIAIASPALQSTNLVTTIHYEPG